MSEQLERALAHSGALELSDDELAHYGVLGMKWGVRKDAYRKNRSSRKNDSSQKTSSMSEKDSRRAKRRLEKAKAKAVAKQTRKQEKADEKAAKVVEEAVRKANTTTPDSNPKKMTDEELYFAIERLRNEKTYNQLVRDLNPPKETGQFKKILKDKARNATAQVVTDLGTTYLKKMLNRAIDKKLPKNLRVGDLQKKGNPAFVFGKQVANTIENVTEVMDSVKKKK